MKLADAIHTVLSEAPQPLSSREIWERIDAGNLWSPKGKTPERTIYSALSRDIGKGDTSRFLRVDRGLYKARAGGGGASIASGQPVPRERRGGVRPADGPMSFLDAAEHVLRQSGQAMMHYQAIMERALSAGLIHTAGKTPGFTLSSRLSTDIRRREDRGEAARFVRGKSGMYGLVQVPADVRQLIEKRNGEVRGRLLERAKEASPDRFEKLIADLLIELGFADVERTPPGGDGGIDVRGTLVVGDVVRFPMAVQAKRWHSNVHAPTVQQVRGSLKVHEQGLIITTSDFSHGAREEARRPDAAPVLLMNGKELAALLARHKLGAQHDHQVLLTLDDQGEDGSTA